MQTPTWEEPRKPVDEAAPTFCTWCVLGLLRVRGNQAGHGWQSHKTYRLCSCDALPCGWYQKETKNSLRIDRHNVSTWAQEQNREGMEEGSNAAIARANMLWLSGVFFCHSESHRSLQVTVCLFLCGGKKKKKKNLIFFNELSLPPFILPFRAIIQIV